MQYAAKHVSVPIARPAEVVYAYASDPANLPRWAPGLVTGAIRRVGAEWVAESPMGTIRLRIAEPHRYGVRDHLVTPADGAAQLTPCGWCPTATARS